MVFSKPDLIMPPVIVPLKEKPKQPANATSERGHNSIAVKIVRCERYARWRRRPPARGLRG